MEFDEEAAALQADIEAILDAGGELDADVLKALEASGLTMGETARSAGSGASGVMDDEMGVSGLSGIDGGAPAAAVTPPAAAGAAGRAATPAARGGLAAAFSAVAPGRSGAAYDSDASGSAPIDVVDGDEEDEDEQDDDDELLAVAFAGATAATASFMSSRRRGGAAAWGRAGGSLDSFGIGSIGSVASAAGGGHEGASGGGGGRLFGTPPAGSPLSPDDSGGGSTGSVNHGTAAAAGAGIQTDDEDEEAEAEDAAGEEDDGAAPPPDTIEGQIAAHGYYITDKELTTTRGTGSGLYYDHHSEGALRCLNGEVMWSLSSARPGCTVHELLSDDPDAYWQSDGLAPHSIMMTCFKRQSIAELWLLLDHASDESYTPAEITIRAGSVYTDCEEVVTLELSQPTGWVHVPFLQPDKKGLQRYLRANMLVLIVVSNHEAGRDCHIRGIKVMGPAGTGTGAGAAGGAGGVAAAAAAGASKSAGGSASSSSSGAPLLLTGAFEDPALTQFASLR